VTPTVDGEPAHPQLVLVDPGPTAVQVTLQLLTPGSVPAAPPVTITVAAGRVAGAPKGFLEKDDRAAVLVTADGPIVALGTSTSGGANGLASYGSAVGIPVPLEALGGR
jgi:predicted dehydrogenase